MFDIHTENFQSLTSSYVMITILVKSSLDFPKEDVCGCVSVALENFQRKLNFVEVDSTHFNCVVLCIQRIKLKDIQFNWLHV